MIPFHWYVLCIGILMCWHANDVMFWGYQAHFGAQKNYATGTFSDVTFTSEKIEVNCENVNLICYDTRCS